MQPDKHRGHVITAIIGITGAFIAALGLPESVRIWGILIVIVSFLIVIIVLYGWMKFFLLVGALELTVNFIVIASDNSIDKRNIGIIVLLLIFASGALWLWIGFFTMKKD